jgi:hypothetical protein
MKSRDPTEDDLALLRLIRSAAAGADRYQMPEATRENDRTRQRCRKAGWIYYRGGRWFLTLGGRGQLMAPQSADAAS